MEFDRFAQLMQRYHNLKKLYDTGQLNQKQFASEVGRLQVQDERGYWWTINTHEGGFLRYDGKLWVPASPPGYSTVPDEPVGKKPSRWRMLASVLAIVTPIFTALLWFGYASLSPSSEGVDCLTPLVLGGVPIALILFQRPIDFLLRPLQPVRRVLPRPFLWGAAIALPLVLGWVCSSATTSGYGVLRLIALVGMLGAHVLLRNPEVQV